MPLPTQDQMRQMGVGQRFTYLDDEYEVRQLADNSLLAVSTDANGAANVAPLHQGGEEQVDSKYNSVLRATQDWKWVRLAAGTAEQVVYAGPCRVGPILIDVGTVAGTLTLRDAAAIGGSNTVCTVAGADTESRKGLRCASGLTVQAATTGAGVIIGYREAKFTD